MAWQAEVYETYRDRHHAGVELARRLSRLETSDVVVLYRVSDRTLEAVINRERAELERREQAYRDGRPPVDVRGRTVVLIDDGLATGSTMKAAVRAVRARQPARVIVAVPVGAPDTCRELAAVADEVVCARTPKYFAAVGQWYDNFRQTTDEEVRELLRAATAQRPVRSHGEAVS